MMNDLTTEPGIGISFTNTSQSQVAVILHSGQVALFEATVADDKWAPTMTKSVPESLLVKYLNGAMSSAHIEPIDGQWFAEIPGFSGVWGNGPDPEKTIADLRDALEDWVLLKIEDEDRDLPVVSGVDLNVI